MVKAEQSEAMSLIQPPAEEHQGSSARLSMSPHTTLGPWPTQSLRPIEISGINFSEIWILTETLIEKLDIYARICYPIMLDIKQSRDHVTNQSLYLQDKHHSSR